MFLSLSVLISGFFFFFFFDIRAPPPPASLQVCITSKCQRCEEARDGEGKGRVSHNIINILYHIYILLRHSKFFACLFLQL